MAYDDPGLAGNLQQFDTQFGLPAPPSLQVLDQNGAAAPLPGSQGLSPGQSISVWNQEEDLDVEWAHAIAPAASIVVIEADSGNLSDLLAGADAAAKLSGVSVVSMSWSNGVSPVDPALDSDFNAPGVTFVAATGDIGSAVTYPASSPNVLAVGGTTLTLGSSGAGETAFNGAWIGHQPL